MVEDSCNGHAARGYAQAESMLHAELECRKHQRTAECCGIIGHERWVLRRVCEARRVVKYVHSRSSAGQVGVCAAVMQHMNIRLHVFSGGCLTLSPPSLILACLYPSRPVEEDAGGG